MENAPDTKKYEGMPAYVGVGSIGADRIETPSGSAMSTLEKELMALEETLGQHISRLKPVLSETEPTDKAREDFAQSGSAEITRSIYEKANRVSIMRDRLRNASNRLEV